MELAPTTTQRLSKNHIYKPTRIEKLKGDGAQIVSKIFGFCPSHSKSTILLYQEFSLSRMNLTYRNLSNITYTWMWVESLLFSVQRLKHVWTTPFHSQKRCFWVKAVKACEKPGRLLACFKKRSSRLQKAGKKAGYWNMPYSTLCSLCACIFVDNPHWQIDRGGISLQNACFGCTFVNYSEKLYSAKQPAFWPKSG